MQLRILSTMTGKAWEGDVSYGFERSTPTATLESIFRAFNRVDEADCKRLDDLGYNLPSLSSGDFVRLTDDDGATYWYLCASVGWVPVTERQALIPQKDYEMACRTAADRGEYANEQRPAMFLSVREDGALIYMRPTGGWQIVPQDSAPTTVSEEKPA